LGDYKCFRVFHDDLEHPGLVERDAIHATTPREAREIAIEIAREENLPGELLVIHEFDIWTATGAHLRPVG
jgi:hypothetical protein